LSHYFIRFFVIVRLQFGVLWFGYEIHEWSGAVYAAPSMADLVARVAAKCLNHFGHGRTILVP